MRKERTVIESALELTFFPILKCVDPALCNHLVRKLGLRCMPDFLVKSVSNWFATDITDMVVASRLIDAFLVSHASMPLYFAVALLTCHRQQILECENLDQLLVSIQSLPLFSLDHEDENSLDDDFSSVSYTSRTSANLEGVEQLITIGLRFM